MSAGGRPPSRPGNETVLPSPPAPVRLASRAAAAPDAWLMSGAVQAAELATGDIDGVVAWAGRVSEDVPLPGEGRTVRRWEWLASVAAQDLTVARVAEPHLDALAILAEAGLGRVAEAGSTWGVYAAEGPGARLEARTESTASGNRWVLSGTKPWCSLAGHLTHALITAWVDQDRRALFAVDLRGDGRDADARGWHAAGLPRVATATLTLSDVPALPVGGPGWYLHRPGFAWGGIGVAAIWYGGAVGLLRRMLAGAGRREPDQVALMHLGAADADLAAAAAMLRSSADAVDAGLWSGSVDPEGPPTQALLAARTRQVVADAAERVLARAGHTLGPGPLSQEPEHVRRVADLTLYLRQHHAERDAASLGGLLLEGERR